jgi:hypothetical protein
LDRALWLLLWLRLRAWARRLWRSARTVRGGLLVGLGVSLFGLWVVTALVWGHPAAAHRAEEVRRYGPWALVGYCLVNLLLSSGENALTFSAAEVNLLFPAPLSRRQLLLYKVAGAAFNALVSGLFFAIFLRQYAVLTVAAVTGVVLAVLLLQLFAMLLGLLASVAGVAAYNRRRKLFLALVAVVAVGAGFGAFGPLLAGDWRGAADELDRVPLFRVLLAPASWFVLAFTAEQLWPDLVQWAALALAVNAVFVLALFALDAHYLEASAAASERQYARLQRLRRGGPAVANLGGTGSFRLTAPPLPALGGVGPVLWRQLTTLLRSWWSLVVVLLLTGVMAAPLLGRPDARGETLPLLAGMLVAMTLVVPTLLPFDFRGDIDRMDLLKTLPLPAWRLVVGQLLTPVLAITVVQCLLVALVVATRAHPEPWLPAVCAFLPPVNFLLFAIENLLFLWFPSRLVATTPGDFQVLGRHLVLWLARLLGLQVMLGLAFAAGFGVFLLTDRDWVAAGATAWVVSVVLSGAVVPLLARAFRRFDVARDTPA